MAQNWQPVPLIPGASADDCKPWAAMDLCGWIPERAEIPGGRSELCAKTLPGLQEFAAYPDCARQRGARNVEGKLFVVFDTTLGEVRTDGSIIVRGTIPGRSRVSMTHNGVNELLIVTGSAGYIYDTSAETLTQITDDGFPGAIVADYIGSLFVAVEPLGRYFFNSALNDGASYNALETYQGETKPDRIVSLIAANGEVIVFSQRSVEHFAYTGTVNALFENKGISKDRGAASTHAVALLDQAVFFLADDGSFYELRGYELRRASTHAIEQAWSRCQLSRAFCTTWEDRGHKVVYITFPDGGTWGFDVSTRLWHRRESEGTARWRLAWLVNWNGDWYGGEYNSGRVFRVDWDYHLEGSDRLIRSCTTGVLHASQKRLRLDALEVVVDAAGEATTAGSVFPLSFNTEQVVSEGVTIGGSLPNLAVGDTVNFRYATKGGVSPVTFAIDDSLPAGLAFDNGTGSITGTTTTAADYSWAVTATDASGDTATLADTSYVINMTGDPPDAVTGDAYSYSLTAVNTEAPVTFTKSSGTLPTGVSLSSAGAFSGTASAAGTFAFDVTLADVNGTDITKAYSVTVTDPPTYEDIVTSLAPIARWKLTEAAGTTMADSIGSLDGTISGTYTLADTELWDGGGPAAKFTAGYVAITSGTALDYVKDSPWAVCAWVRLTSNSAGSVRASILNNLVNSGLGYTNGALYLTPSGGVHYPYGGWTDSGTNVISAIGSGDALSLNTTYHVAIIYDGTTRKLVVNGVEKASNTTEPPAPATTGGTYIGGDAANNGSYKFVGNLGDVMVFNTAITVADCLSLYETGHL